MITVGAFQLDVERRVLRGAGGEVELSPLGARLLRFLADRPGEIVSRNALIDELWAGNYLVGDPGLNRLISETRKLAQRLSPRVLIETVQKTGYRLLPDPQPGPTEVAAAAPIPSPAAAAAVPATGWSLPSWAGWLLVMVVAAALLNWLMDTATGLIWAARGGE